MTDVSIRELRNDGGSVVARVLRGELITITRSGTPVAELRPATAGPVTEKAPGQYLCEVTTVIEIEGADKPALIAEGLIMYVIGG